LKRLVKNVLQRRTWGSTVVAPHAPSEKVTQTLCETVNRFLIRRLSQKFEMKSFPELS